eukprot:1511333-Amphidinium_carterae.1
MAWQLQAMMKEQKRETWTMGSRKAVGNCKGTGKGGGRKSAVSHGWSARFACKQQAGHGCLHFERRAKGRRKQRLLWNSPSRNRCKGGSGTANDSRRRIEGSESVPHGTGQADLD